MVPIVVVLLIVILVILLSTLAQHMTAAAVDWRLSRTGLAMVD